MAKDSKTGKGKIKDKVRTPAEIEAREQRRLARKAERVQAKRAAKAAVGAGTAAATRTATGVATGAAPDAVTGTAPDAAITATIEAAIEAAIEIGQSMDPVAETPAAAPVSPLDPAEHLGDIDAWNLRAEGDWLRFEARIDGQPRGFLRPRQGGDIIADAPGPLRAILSLGGPRRAGFLRGPPRFAYHILAPADHIGAVGAEGTIATAPSPGLQRIAHRSRDALIADLLLGWRYRAGRGLPLVLVRSETDCSAAIADLGHGQAMRNFLTALDTLRAAAASLGRRPQVLAVAVDFGTEDLHSDAGEFATGFRHLLDRITAEMRARAMPAPVFLASPEAGDHPSTRALCELAWSHGRHRLILPCPGYAFARDRFGRPLGRARARAAEMDAYALAAVESGEDWQCPLPLLAEYRGHEIRVSFRALRPLIVDADDPFSAGPGAGFAISGSDIRVQSVRRAADDAQALILTCDRALCPLPDGQIPQLLFALGPGGSAVRDDWAAEGWGAEGWCAEGWQSDQFQPDGAKSDAPEAGDPASLTSCNPPPRRWALPAVLPLHPAPSGIAFSTAEEP